MFLNLYNHLIHSKLERTYFEKYIEMKLRSKVKFKQLYFLIYQQLFKKRCQNDTNFLSSRNKSKSVSRNWISFSWKLLKNYIEITATFRPINIMSKKVSQNNIDFWFIEIASNKVHRNNVDFLPSEITWKKVCQKDVDFSPIKITPKKPRRTEVDFLPIQTTSKKAHRNNVDFSSIEITLHIKMMLKFVDNFSSTYWCNIVFELTPIRRGVSVGMFVRLMNI